MLISTCGGAWWADRRETREVGLHSNLFSTVALANSRCQRIDDRYGLVEDLLATVLDLCSTHSTIETNTRPRICQSQSISITSTALRFRRSSSANQRRPSFQRRNTPNPHTHHRSSRSCSSGVELSEMTRLAAWQDRRLGRTHSSDSTRIGHVTVTSRPQQRSHGSQ